MADDDAAPDGELTETSATDEHSGAAEPESASHEKGTTSDAKAADETADEAVASDDEVAPEQAVGPEDEAVASDDEVAPEQAVGPSKWRMSHVRLAMIAGLVVVLALAGLTGWTGYRAYNAYQGEKQRELFLQVGRQGAINLTTIDWEHAEADVQRVLDSATGTFYDDFQNRAAPFIQVVKQAQSKSVGSISEAGLESASNEEAQVLVAVAVNTSNVGAPQQEPRAWRMRLTVTKVGEDAKVSNVEFVP
jgi:Mce-associated membrane protein